MTTRALVTGGGGFVGQWLSRAMVARGWEVFAAGLGGQVPGILQDAERQRIHWLEMDVRSRADVGSALDVSRPEMIVHLAGISYVPDAADAPAEAYAVNVLGVVTLLAEVAQRRARGALDPRVLVVGSAEQYGRHQARRSPAC